MITVHGRTTSVNVQPVVWCLAELGLDFERLDVGGPFGGNDTPDYLKMNPLGLVPVLVDEGVALPEAPTILRYLMRKYGDHPSDPMAAAQLERWSDMVRQHVYVPLIPCIFVQFIRVTAKDRDIQAVEKATAELKTGMAILQDQIKGPYFSGDTLSLVDYQLGGLLYRYYELDFDRADLPGLKAYYNALCSRPAYREHVMVEFKHMKVPGA